MNPLPIVCTLDAAELQERRSGLLAHVAALAEGRREVEGGLALRFAPAAGVLQELGNLIDLERQCCRFLRFRLTVEPDGGPIELELTGPAGTGEYLQTMIPELREI